MNVRLSASRPGTLPIWFVLALLITAPLSAFELDSITVGGGELWTVNRYNLPWAESVLQALAPDRDVTLTGSAGVPIDPEATAGVRFAVAQLRDGAFPVSFEPSLGLSARNYLLYPSGRVVPTQVETELGDEMGQPGVGRQRLLTATVRIPWYIGYQIVPRYGVAFGVSLSTLWRIPFFDNAGEPRGVAGYFYENARFFMPELILLNRIEVTDALGADIVASAMLPVYHIWDGNQLPFFDQAKVGIGVQLRVRLPLSQLLPEAEPTQSQVDQQADDAAQSEQSTP